MKENERTRKDETDGATKKTGWACNGLHSKLQKRALRARKKAQGRQRGTVQPSCEVAIKGSRITCR
jgi:hypothetical protein